MRPIKDQRAIRIALIKNGVRGVELARQLGVTKAAIYHVISGHSVSRRIGLALISVGVPARLLREYGEQA